MFENFKPKNPSQDKITESALATLRSERESAHGELGTVMEFFRNNQGSSIELIRDGEKLGIMIDGSFAQTGVVSENTETETIDKPLSSLSTIDVSTINGAGLSAYEGTAGQKYEGAKNNILKYITETFSKSGFILSVQDTPLQFWEEHKQTIEDLGIQICAQGYGANYKTDGTELYRPVNTILINSRLAPGLGIIIENLQFVPHYQGIHTVTDDNGVSTGERVSIGQNWEANYAGRNDSSNDFAFGTLLLDVVLTGTDGTKSIRVGNLYMAPPSYMTERGRSWQASLTHASAKTEENQPILVMGDGNTYGMNSAMQGPLHTASYPLSAGVAALTRTDIDENDHWTKIAERKGFVMDKSSETDPTIEKAGGAVGMRLDHFAAKGVKDYKIGLSKVPFSDHNLLTARVVL